MRPFFRRHPYIAILALIVVFIPMLIGHLWPSFAEACEDQCRAIGMIVHYIRTGEDLI